MPSRWRLRLGAAAKKAESHFLHAAMCAILDGEGHYDHTKSFAISPAETVAENRGQGDSCTVEVRLLLDDRGTIDRFVDGVNKLAVNGLRLGSETVAIAKPEGPVRVGHLSLIEALTWAELANGATEKISHHLRFRTPFYVREGNTALVLPAPGSILRSMRAKWEFFAPGIVPPVGARDLDVVVRSFSGGTRTRRLGSVTHTGFVGSVELVGRSRSVEHQKILSQLISASPFTGVGSATTLGCGTVELG